MRRGIWPGDLIRLTHGARVTLDDLKVHLLSDEGEQVPPGTYSVRVTYVNDGGKGMETYLDSTGVYHTRRYNGSWGVWSGRAASAPYALKVLPAPPALVEVVIPTALGWTRRRSRDAKARGIECLPAYANRVVVQPGFHASNSRNEAARFCARESLAS